MSISVKAEDMETTAAFTYLNLTVTYTNRNWAALYQNLRKAWRRWGMVTKVTTKTV